MSVSDPTIYQVFIELTAEEYFEALQRANAAGHKTIQSFFKDLGKPAAELIPSKQVVHSIPEDKDKKK